MVCGLCSRDIVFDMGIVERIVKVYFINIYNKFGVNLWLEVVVVVVEKGILYL